MKNKLGIWIDSEKAIILNNGSNEKSLKIVESAIENKTNHEKESDKGTFSGSQHMNNESKFEERKKHQLTDFLKAVVSHVEDGDAVYIIGPSETKKHLKSKIEDEKTLSKTTIVIEAAERMTDNQFVAKVSDHYSN